MSDSLSLIQIAKAIDEGNFNAFLNQYENIYFDCKRAPYPLHSHSQKREFVKDITSFANSAVGEGYVLIGIIAEKSASHTSDQITGFSPLKESDIHSSQYHDILKEWVYPELQGIKIYMKPLFSEKPDAMIGVIHIPRQIETSRPFLIKRDVVSEEVSQTMFGYVERMRDTSSPQQISSIHSFLRNGILFDRTLEDRFNKLENKLEKKLEEQQIGEQKQSYQKILPERIKLSLEAGGMISLPNFCLVGYPQDLTELKTLFNTHEGSIRRIIESPPELRYAGWSLATLDRAKIKEGKFIRVMNGQRKVVDLYKDGTLIFGVLATSDFLAWGRTSAPEFRLNPLALVESTYSFMNVYSLVIKDFKIPPKELAFNFGFNNLWQKEGKYFLPAGELTTWGHDHSEEAPKSGIFSEPIKVPRTGFNAEHMANQLIEEIYIWFGLNKEDIPYTKLKDGNRVIDFERISGIQ